MRKKRTYIDSKSNQYHNHIKKAYGITYNQFLEQKAVQGERCAICGKWDDLNVDHDHATGVCRGLLCRTCNLGLGAFQDSEELLVRARLYLKAGGCWYWK